MRTLTVSTRQREEMVDVTGLVRESVRESAVREGVCLVYSPHTTCGVTVNEGWDPDVVTDALTHLHELVPREHGFRHAEGNSDAHIKTMLVGAAASLPVAGGELRLGRWQAVFLCEFDGPRSRELWVVVNGDR
ncbi:MAG TPA: secondary thiamine-phosphate synthase enzyme YjbQ [Candidatus Dormibacteraeota bacterium]|nr:secondary thiamine-phosphate synthase enzyme YjbQ [Candidatus Dormibacteraeota bacterium]